MNFIKLLALCSLFTLGIAHGAVVTDNEVVTQDGPRHYLLGTPEVTDRAGMPLVIVLHGHMGSSQNTLGKGLEERCPLSEWRHALDQHGLVVAALDGAKGEDGKPGWNDGRPGGTGNPTTDDVAFVQAVITRVEQQWHTDPSRVYIMGMSNGGVFTFRLAIELPHPIAAIAAACSSMPGDHRPALPPHGMSVIMFEGTADPLMPYFGGQVHFREKMRGAVLGTDETIAYWRQADGLTANATAQSISHRDFKGDSSQVTRYTWGNPAGPQIVLYRVDGGGHCEPSIDHRYGKLYTKFCGQQNADLECVQEAWAFFRDKRSSAK